MAEPQVVVCYYEGCGGTLAHGLVLMADHQRDIGIPHDSKNSGSVSLTIGNRLKFCAYMPCDTTLNALNPTGNLSTTRRTSWTATTPYMSRYSNFFASTVCSSTSSER
jgi:hypothetical protein